MMLHPVSPLVIPTQPFPGESLVGLVARATAANKLLNSRIILEEVGLPLNYAGIIGTNATELASRLADKIGCSEKDVVERTHPYHRSQVSRAISWGSTVIIRYDLDLKQKWLSPISLRSQPYHREAWLCRLLPYCPESAEKLIGVCSTCGQKLGWSRCWSITSCEHCRAEITSPAEPKLLSPDKLGHYRIFAGLMSPDKVFRDRTVAKLPDEVQRLSPMTMRSLVLGLGALVNGKPVESRATAYHNSEPDWIAQMVCDGAALLSKGPGAIGDAVRLIFNGLRSDGSQINFDLAVKAVRNLAGPSFEVDQREFIRAAAPDAFRHSWRITANLGDPTLLGSEAHEILQVGKADLKALLAANLIKHELVREGKRTIFQFDVTDLKAFVAARKGAVRSAAIEQELGLPRYAVEQLAAKHILEREAHVGLNGIHPDLWLCCTSVETLRKSLRDAVLPEAAAEAVHVQHLIRIIPGQKPWAAIVEAIVDGKLRYWQSGNTLFRTMYITPSDFNAAIADAGRQKTLNFPLQQYVSSTDAADILSCDTAMIRHLDQTGALALTQRNPANVCDLDQVMHVAAIAISVQEIVARASLNRRAVHFHLKRMIQRKHPLGWYREDIEPLISELAGKRKARTRNRSKRQSLRNSFDR